MSTHDVIKFSTYTGNFGFKVPYLLEIGYPYESNYTAIYYTIGDLTFYTNAILDFSYNLADETVINPYKLYNLGSGFCAGKSRVLNPGRQDKAPYLCRDSKPLTVFLL